SERLPASLPLSGVFCSHSATPAIYTPSLHDALPILPDQGVADQLHAVLLGEPGLKVGGDEVEPSRLRLRGAPLHLVPRREGVERSEEHTSELQSRENLVCRLLLEKKKTKTKDRQAGQ